MQYFLLDYFLAVTESEVSQRWSLKWLKVKFFKIQFKFNTLLEKLYEKIRKTLQFYLIYFKSCLFLCPGGF